ncbi:MAG: DUF1592 domain-containing protein [Verrucomicrobiales bacterium]|nr:DUF1592 domain-containing protein [Verrucomicrobiales bacterium]
MSLRISQSILFGHAAPPLFRVLVASCLLSGLSVANDKTPDWKPVVPVLEKYCFDCHGGAKTKGNVDMKALAENLDVSGHFDLWETVLYVIEDGEMPPPDDPQPDERELGLMMSWLETSLDAAAMANAGDPGPVTVRRLTNFEYDNTIRDLTGIDFDLSKNFQPDGGGGEGFSNVGDVLFVNPQQLDSYLSAARHLTDHASILPGSGVQFRKSRVGLRSPVQFRTEAEQELYIWYQKMAEPHLPRDGADRRGDEYMLAAWKYKHRDKTGAKSLDQIANESGLVAAFLNNWWNMLNSENPKSRILDLIRVPWRNLPVPVDGKPGEVPAAVKSRILDIEAKHLAWNKREGEGWTRTQRRQQDTDGLRTRTIVQTIPAGEPVHLVAGDFGDGNRGDLILFGAIELDRKGHKRENYFDWLKRRSNEIGKQLAQLKAKPQQSPGDKKKIQQLSGFQKSCQTMLSRFGKHPQQGRKIGAKELAIRPPETLRLPFDGGTARFRVSAKMDLQFPEADQGTHQWTITGKNPPDPTQIIPGALIIYKRQTDIARKTMGDFSRMKQAFPDEYNRLLEEVARNYLRGGKGPGVYYLNDDQLRATLTDWQRTRHDRMLLDWRLLKSAKPNQQTIKEIDHGIISHLHWWTHRAWRRDLSDEEKHALNAIYYGARKTGMDQETAAREVLTRVFVSPDFLFKIEASDKPGVQPVSPWELASRLSYFLWASTPDTTLLQAARDGSLMTPKGRAAQVKRMLRDPKSTALADAFAGQWLEFHGFAGHNAVDKKLFPEFTPELRADMAHETDMFFSHLIREDRPVREILMADYTFLNERLAKHYAIPGVKGEKFRQMPVAKYQRGGLLGMGSVLTKTSFPQRTSPVLRGHWLLAAVLGQPTPPPPNDVPELEAVTDAKTLREKLERHAADKACASCHAKIDPLGFALESFDPIGRLRTKDDTGSPVDDLGTLSDGTKLDGVAGLREYLGRNDAEFYKLFARKLIGYATGRAVISTDRELIDTIRDRLQKGEGRFSEGILTLVESRQFLYRRNEDNLSE